jgi:hypothetical protein
MSIVVRFSPESLTSDQYDQVVRRLEEENLSPADGLDYELCFGSGDKMRVSLVWDSKEPRRARGARRSQHHQAVRSRHPAPRPDAVRLTGAGVAPMSRRGAL